MIPSGTLVYYSAFKFYFDKYGMVNVFSSHINNIGDLSLFLSVDTVPLLYIENVKYDEDKIFSFGDDWSTLLTGRQELITAILTLFKNRPENVDGYLFNTDGEMILTRTKENKFLISSAVKTFAIKDKESVKQAIAGFSNGKLLFRVNNTYKMFAGINNKNFQMLLLPVLIQQYFDKDGETAVAISEEFAYLSYLFLCQELGLDTPSIENFRWSFKDLLPMQYNSNPKNILNIQKIHRLRNLLPKPKVVDNKSIEKLSDTFIPYKLIDIFNGNETQCLLSNFLKVAINKPDNDCIFITDVDLLGYYVNIKKEDIIFMGIKNKTLYIAFSTIYSYGEFYDKITLENLLTVEFPELKISTYKIGGNLQ